MSARSARVDVGSPDRPSVAGTSLLALHLHFLFEAVRLELLPSVLVNPVRKLAAAAEAGQGNLARLAEEAGAAFLDSRAAIGLGGQESSPAASGDTGLPVSDVLGRCTGDARPRAAAQRLGRFCEALLCGSPGRRAGGAFFTPDWLAGRIAATVVRGIVTGRRVEPASAAALRVLDPAAGAGAFLVAALDAMAEVAGEGEEENDLRRAVVGKCLCGLEIHPLAAEACRLAVWLAASRPGRPAHLPADLVAACDALDHTPPPRAFDLVLGNPPWGVKFDGRRAARLSQAAPAALSGHRDSYLFFLHLAAEAARDDGAVGMVLPDVLLWQVRYEPMRRALLERFRPLSVVLLGSGAFLGATAPACALSLVGRPAAPEAYLTADLSGLAGEALSAASWEGPSVPRETPFSAPHHSLLVSPPRLTRLLDRLSEAFPSLGSLQDTFRFHDVGINYPRAEIGRALLYTGDRADARDIPVTRGRDFGPLTAVGHSAWLRHDWRERVGPARGVSVRDQLYCCVPKLLLRQTGDRPVATVDRRGMWFGRSVIAVTGSGERDLLWLAAVLNSRAFAALYRALVPERGRRFAQVKVSKLKLLPVPRREECEQLGELAGAVYDEPDSARRSALMERLDAGVYEAYGLTDGERRMVDGLVPVAAPSRRAAAARARPGRRGATSSTTPRR